MIAPTSANLEVARRKPFHLKTETLHQRDRPRVVRLNVRFEPVESQFPETVRGDQAQSCAHEAAPSERLECVVAKVSRLEATAYDFADVDYAGDVVATHHNDEAHSIAISEALDVVRELTLIGGWRDPTSMKIATATDRAQERLRMPQRRLLESHGIDHEGVPRSANSGMAWVALHGAQPYTRSCEDL